LNKQKNHVIITGMHRSGTSFLSRSLNICGLHLGPEEDFYDSELNPKSGNPKGHWENTKIHKLNDRLLKLNGGSWDRPPHEIKKTPRNFEMEIKKILSTFYKESALAYGFKDPRITITLESWKPILPNFIIAGIFRHPLKVAESLKVRDGFDYKYSLSLWEIYNRKLLAHLKKYQGFLLNFDWPKDKLLPETRIMAKKIGLIDMDLTSWFSEKLRQSDKSYEKDYPLPKTISNLYSELEKFSTKNHELDFHIPTPTINQFRKIIHDAKISESFLREHYLKISSDLIKKGEFSLILRSSNDPLFSLLAYYYNRKDLQEGFPEVLEKSDFTGLINWIVNVCDGKFKDEKEARIFFLKFKDKYKEFQQNKIKITE